MCTRDVPCEAAMACAAGIACTPLTVAACIPERSRPQV